MFSFLFLFIETMLPTMAPHLTMYFLSTTRAGVMLAIMSRINSFYHVISKLKPVAGSFPRSGVEAKHGVEFRHSTQNASRIRRKVGSGVF